MNGMLLVSLRGRHAMYSILVVCDPVVATIDVIIRKHLLDEDLRFSNSRHVALYPMDPCIISCECKPEIAMVDIQEIPELLRASLNILKRIMDVSHL